MNRVYWLAMVGLAAMSAIPSRLVAQDGEWNPPSREMPVMPRVSELRGDWHSPRAAWFRGVDGVAGVGVSALQASGEPRSGNAHAQLVRFSDGPVPVVVWTDRNGDTRADMIEIFKAGGIIIQLIDADFDGAANVVRVYDSQGKLLRQNQM